MRARLLSGKLPLIFPSRLGSMTALSAFSEEIAALVDRLGRSVVGVHLGRHGTVAAFCWRPGVLLTVAHPIRRGGDVGLVLADGASARASVAGVDPSTDLAVLRFDAAGIEPAELGDGNAVRTGHWVYAVTRSARGELAVDHGLVGTAGAAWQTWRGGRIDRLLRLDGGLAPGFSGAPVAGADGKVIGLASAALARGAGIAIPVATLERVAEQLLAHGRIARGYLGVAAQPVEAALPATAPAEPPARQRGLLVTQLSDGGPAERAGLLIGDILLAVGDRPTPSIDELQAALAAATIGQPVGATLARGGERVQKTITLEERPRSCC
jgi:S1-C subfamily serine protease